MLWQLAKRCLRIPGSFLEVGVYRGGTSFLLAWLAATKGKAFTGCDTFDGMPETKPELDPCHQKGDFSETSEAAVSAHLSGFSTAVLLPGRFPQSAQDILSSEKFAFAHVDVDIYDSVLETCEFVWPRLNAGGIMVFDDYGFQQCRGAKKAVDLFFDSRGPIYLPTGQAVICK
jgi:O-methyltransferase